MGGMAAQIPIKNDEPPTKSCCARQGARPTKQREAHRRPRWHLGRPSRPGGQLAREDLRRRHMPGPEPDREGCATDVDVGAADLLRVPDRHRTEAGAAPERLGRHPVPGGLAARLGLRAALRPDGGRGDRRDLAAPRSGSGSTTAPPSTTAARIDVELFEPDASPRSSDRRSEQLGAESATIAGLASTLAARLFEQLVAKTSSLASEFLTLVAYPVILTTRPERVRIMHDFPSNRNGRADMSNRQPQRSLPSRADRNPERHEADATSAGNGIKPRLHDRGGRAPARLGAHRVHARRRWVRAVVGPAATPRSYVNALGALTGNQAVQQVKRRLQAIYLSGWQVAADANLAGQMYPDQSLYPANSVCPR